MHGQDPMLTWSSGKTGVNIYLNLISPLKQNQMQSSLQINILAGKVTKPH